MLKGVNPNYLLTAILVVAIGSLIALYFGSANDEVFKAALYTSLGAMTVVKVGRGGTTNGGDSSAE